MFGIGTPELLVILVVALVVLGPKRIPDIARSLGKGLAEFRRVTGDITQEFRDAETAVEDEPPKLQKESSRSAASPSNRPSSSTSEPTEE